MEIVFLEANQRLTKRYTLRQNGLIESDSYPHVSDFTSHTAACNTLDLFKSELISHAKAGHCLLKGQLTKPLVAESRAGSTDANTPTNFMVLDVDGLPDHTPETVMHTLGLSDVSYIVQYSSSQGVVATKGLSCHIFVLLSAPILPSTLKLWLIEQNLVKFLSHTTLTRSGVALHYPLDITACQNDKLIYIAPPICTPPSLDKFPTERILLIQKPKSHFDFPTTVAPQVMHVEKRINELRKDANLPIRKNFTLKTDGTQPYLSKPDQAEVTGAKTARGFTYLNINGGDSFAYWHPEDSFEYIFNFKGEPAYKTAEFVPNYYFDQLRARRKLLTGVRNHYVFRDPRADIYYAGWHDPNTNSHEFNIVSARYKLDEYLAQFGIPPQKVINDWTCTFDPQRLTQIDPKNQYWNRFTPSKYMVTTTTAPAPTSPPPTISTIIRHVLGVDDAIFTGFINWIAFAIQFRRNAGTAWIAQGVPGTGKGILVNYILKPLFGASNFTARRMEELEDKYNGYLEDCLICYIDEVHVGVSKRADIIMANLKNQITEPRITIRNMRQTAYEVPNYLNWIMSSNMTTPIVLDKEDRRFNVGAYQTHPIRDLYPDTTALLAQVADELQNFASFLLAYKVDIDAVRIPIHNEARQALIDNSKTSLDVIGDALVSGDMATLASYIPDGIDTSPMLRGDAYKNLLQELTKTRRNKVTRDEIATIFLYTVGDVPQTPAKFTRFLGHRGIKLKKVRVGDKTSVGIDVEWTISDELATEILTGSAPPRLKMVKPEDKTESL